MTAIISKRGELLQTIYANEETIKLNKPAGCLAVSSPPNPNMYYAGWWRKMPEQPSLFHIFDYESKTWVDQRSIEQIKDQKWSEIKTEREATEYGGFSFLDHVFDSNPVSQSRIITASELSVDVEWTTKDNSVVLLNAGQLKDLRIALAMHVASCHERSRIARQLIYDANSIDEINLIQY
ncbi:MULTISPECIES: DUF4376 domain-containing protein [Acinetobacter]|uniref:DUF4376 domain-containing protein n=1 Tax=Acinetobacter piscicola TaxID=2006115 RepID=A0A7S7AHC4_9GAMM|nr:MULTISPECIES: DUF4376 domain-containing protein [Acinetobacter]QOW45801.1 DUF4376 domain-containing protein [Acinetobacter piscicola]